MQEDQKTVLVHLLPGAPANAAEFIRPAQARRDWMDRTPDKYAYRCLPLSAANTLGWEILNPVNCEFIWNGMTPPEQVFVYQQNKHKYGPRSHFGSGVITWELPFLFQTPPDYGLMVTGPSNHDHSCVTPLDGFVRTDWLPFPFTVNWRITKPTETIRFAAGEPIARVFAYPLAMMEEMDLKIQPLSDNPDLEAGFAQWQKERQGSYEKRRQTSHSKPTDETFDRRNFWSRQYASGNKRTTGNPSSGK